MTDKKDENIEARNKEKLLTAESKANSLREELEIVQNQLKKVNSESAGRRIKIGEMETEIDTLKDANDKLKDDTKFNELQEKYDTVADKYSKVKEFQKKEYLKEFQSIKDEKNFDKIKEKLKLPEMENEKYKWDDMDYEDIEYNHLKINEYKDLGLFKVDTRDTQTGHTAHQEERNPLEMAKNDPEAYAKYYKQKYGKEIK